MLRKLESRVRARYHIAIAEVGAQDNWQRLVIGFAIVGSDRVSVERTSADVARFIERLGLAKLVRDDHELLAYGSEPMGDNGLSLRDLSGPADADDPDGDGQNFADAEWIPASWKTEGGL